MKTEIIQKITEARLRSGIQPDKRIVVTLRFHRDPGAEVAGRIIAHIVPIGKAVGADEITVATAGPIEYVIGEVYRETVVLREVDNISVEIVLGR